MSRSYLHIPPYAQPDQVNAFADRDYLLRRLYTRLVNAGNEVRRGNINVRRAFAVHGYMGVGKSALLLEALAMLRAGEQRGRPPLDAALPKPEEPERWVIMRLSGKHIGNTSAFGDAVKQLAADDFTHQTVLALGQDMRGEAGPAIDRATRLPVFSSLFKGADRKLYHQVKESLDAASAAIEFTRVWYGADVKKTHKQVSAQSVKAELEARFGVGLGDGALKLAQQIIMKMGADLNTELTVERQWRIGTEIVVYALNAFLAACHAAKLPTILLLDDFDEFASSFGPDYERRAQVLSWLLGTVNKFAPTCLLLGLRQEYEIPDIGRQLERLYVPPMTPVQFAQAIDAWGDVQQPELPVDERNELKQLARHLFSSALHDEPILLPFQCLQILRHAWDDGATTGTPARVIFEQYLMLGYNPGVRRAVQTLARGLSAEQIQAVAEATSVEIKADLLTTAERHHLVQAGFERPDVAGKDTGRVLFDPLIAYVAFAQAAVQAA